MVLELLDNISIITAFQLLLLALVLINHKKGKKPSNKILSAFMFANAFLIVNFILAKLKITTIPQFYYIGISSYLLLAPLLYLYTKSLCYHDFSVNKKHILHLLPFVICSAFLIIHFQVRMVMLEEELSLVRLTMFDHIMFDSMLHVQILCYIIATLKTLQDYRKELKDLFSSIEHINLSWLLLIIIGFILMWLADFTDAILSILRINSKAIHDMLLFISLTINFSFANIVVYKGLKQPEIFSGIEQGPKYANSRLTKEESERHIKKLLSYMKTQKPYLMPSITINELAEKIAIPARYLSQEINDVFNQNFFDFINFYRIEEAKRIFENSSHQKKTILEVLYEVGFNSKSVFNSAFKKHTGLTPTEFKKVSCSKQFKNKIIFSSSSSRLEKSVC